MSRAGFDTKTRAHAALAQPTSFYDPSRHDGQEERDSMSGSDDGNYLYHDSMKGDGEHTSLTSQTLNTDGTPKRPMNAFMIFARRRRPQVSAENQAMRTGEISKILSREWNNMETSQKQFYQEQARQLKDSFNTKYPDYVYRRRPNNTRRKRKLDAPGQRPPDSHPSLGDDMGYDDPGDSPTDGDDLHSPEAMSDIHRSRLGHDLHHNDKYRQPTSRASPYSYPSHDSRSTSTHDPRVSYDASLGGRQEGSYGQQAHTSTLHYTYPSAQSNGHSQTQSMNTFSQSSLDTRSDWNLRPSPWLGTEQSQDRSFTALSAPKAERPLTSPSWNRSSLPSSNPAPSSLTLPTLSSPFFPTDTSHPLSPQSSSQSISTSYGSSHMHSPSLAGREFGHHEISISPGPPLSIAPQYHSGSDRSGLMHVPRHWEGPRALPPISNYSQLHPPFSPLSASGGQQAYWAKD